MSTDKPEKSPPRAVAALKSGIGTFRSNTLNQGYGRTVSGNRPQEAGWMIAGCASGWLIEKDKGTFLLRVVGTTCDYRSPTKKYEKILMIFFYSEELVNLRGTDKRE